MEQYLEIGKIVNTHGVKGEVKVIPLTDDPSRFDDLKWVYVDKGAGLEKFNIQGVKYFKNFVILKFKEVGDMNVAEAMKERLIKIDRQNAVRLPKDSFFICDLIECEVFEENGNRLGVLKNIFKTGSNDVFVVKNEKKEILIPALKKVIKEVCLQEKKIIVELPEGLVDDEV